MVRIYRDHHGLFACNAISYNHESPRRGENFVTRKICRAAAEIKLRKRSHLSLGNLDARRDWSDARDTVRGFLMILDHSAPDDLLFLPAARRTPCGTLRKQLSRASASIGSNTCASTSASCARPTRPTSAVIPPKPGRSSAGSRYRRSAN